jgi:hypothetical protein
MTNNEIGEKEKQKLRAMMYDNTSSDEPATHTKGISSDAFKISYSGGKSTSISADGKQVEIPNIGYVNSLEQKIIAQHRVIVKLQNVINALRSSLNKHTDDINNLKRDLNNKMNMKD